MSLCSVTTVVQQFFAGYLINGEYINPILANVPF